MPRRTKPEPAANANREGLPAGVTVSYYAPGKARVTYTDGDGQRHGKDCAPGDVEATAALLAGR